MIKIFFHIATIGDYQRIVDELISDIRTSGLLDRSDKTILGIVGDGRLINIPSECDAMRLGHVGQFEFPTLAMMQSDARSNHNTKYLYIHTKGATTKFNLAIEDWRAYMTYFCIIKHINVINKLDSVDCAGCDWRTDPVPHFSGNFWWANGRYLAALPDIAELGKSNAPAVLSVRHNAEFWVGMGNPRYEQLWDSGIDQYSHHLVTCPKERYING